MIRPSHDELDLTISRVIKAPRGVVWNAWSDPASFQQWWIPAPAKCKVVEMDLRPGGGFVTQISENGGAFVPHMNGCFLAVDEQERIVFTTCLTGGWRPAEEPFMTAIITLADIRRARNTLRRPCTRTAPTKRCTSRRAFMTAGARSWGSWRGWPSDARENFFTPATWRRTLASRRARPYL
jgi:uncharacterized protein YndB with AHSA1/START domain